MKRSICVFVILVVCALSEATTQNLHSFFDEADAFFSSYVTNGKIDYKAIYSEPQSLQSVLEKAREIKVSTSNPDQYKAFWINAYNLAVIKGIIDNYPTDSPLAHPGFFDTVTYDLGGNTLTLNDIENKKLRAEFSEPRFHFVLVCGALSCPPIISKAYRPETLERQLQQQSLKAINDPNFIKVSKNKVALSEIFKWYKEDFVTDSQEVIDFINRFRETKIPTDSKVSYYPYDWSLNSL